MDDSLPHSTIAFPRDPEAFAALSFEELARIAGQTDSSPRSRPLRQRAETDDPALSARLDALAAEVVAQVAAPKARFGKTRGARLAANVRLLPLNLLAAHRQDPLLCVAVPCGKPWFEDASIPRSPVLSHSFTVEMALATLLRLGYAELLRTGSPEGGKYSEFRATDALVAQLGGGDAGGTAPSPAAIRLHRHHDPIVVKAPKGAEGEEVTERKVEEQDPLWLEENARAPWELEAGYEADERRKGPRPGAPITFPDTPDTRRMRGAVEAINAANRPGRVSLAHLSAEELSELAEDLRGRRRREGRWRGGVGEWGGLGDEPPEPEGVASWLTQTALYRVFNGGGFDLGGRFYGAAWQLMPGEWRARLRVDGERVAEPDFRAIHPRMALHLLDRVEAPEDPYADVADLPRDLVKLAANAMLNMARGTDRPPAWFRRSKAGGLPWREVRDRIVRGMPYLARHFGTGLGLRLQRVDSDVAEEVMLHFARRGEVCLGVYDSFVVRAALAEEAAEVMRRAYRERVGFEPSVRVREG